MAFQRITIQCCVEEQCRPIAVGIQFFIANKNSCNVFSVINELVAWRVEDGVAKLIPRQRCCSEIESAVRYKGFKATIAGKNLCCGAVVALSVRFMPMIAMRCDDLHVCSNDFAVLFKNTLFKGIKYLFFEAKITSVCSVQPLDLAVCRDWRFQVVLCSARLRMISRLIPSSMCSLSHFFKGFALSYQS